MSNTEVKLDEMIEDMANNDRTVAMIEEFNRESCFKLKKN